MPQSYANSTACRANFRAWKDDHASRFDQAEELYLKHDCVLGNCCELTSRKGEVTDVVLDLQGFGSGMTCDHELEL